VKGNGAKLSEAVRARLQREMPGASYVTITPMTDILDSQTQSWHLGATMFVAFGGLALVLAAVGLYSVIAYNVAQRTHELAVRVALGAEARNIVALVVMEGLRVAIAGIMAGVLVAFFVGRWVKPLLFQVSPRDPRVFVAVGAVLIFVAVAASAVPAMRASRTDPNDALRSE
jgi:ABC-type antimicrobial peptide transport system permease subunit